MRLLKYTSCKRGKGSNKNNSNSINEATMVYGTKHYATSKTKTRTTITTSKNSSNSINDSSIVSTTTNIHNNDASIADTTVNFAKGKSSTQKFVTGDAPSGWHEYAYTARPELHVVSVKRSVAEWCWHHYGVVVSLSKTFLIIGNSSLPKAGFNQCFVYIFLIYQKDKNQTNQSKIQPRQSCGV